MNTRALAIGAIERGAIQKISELSPFLELAKRSTLKTVVEIGTYRGGTFWALCQIASPDALIVSIDLPGGPFGGGYTKEQAKVIKGYGRGRQKLRFLTMDSHEYSTVDALKKILKGRQIDLLLIDGDHTYPGCKKDWQLYSPLVKENGIIVFHDILHHPKQPDCQVEYVWKELKNKFPSTAFTDMTDPEWGGIGVLVFKEKPPQKYDPKVGLLLDLNPWPTKQPGFTGIGRKAREGVDIIHNLEEFPWPFEDNSCHIVVGHFIFQKIQPRLTIRFMNELWRIIKPLGQLALSVPYGDSPGYFADPMNCNPCNEMTFFYFDPAFPAYGHYEPKPWEIMKGSPQWVWGANLEVLMRPRKDNLTFSEQHRPPMGLPTMIKK